MSSSVSVKCENRSQYCYMVAWCEDNGFDTPKKLVPLGCYPIILVINRDYSNATWTKSVSNALVENVSLFTFEEFAEDSQPSPGPPIESGMWIKLKWWQRIKPGDKFLDLPSDKWVMCVNLVGFLVWDLVVIRPSKLHTT